MEFEWRLGVRKRGPAKLLCTCLSALQTAFKEVIKRCGDVSGGGCSSLFFMACISVILKSRQGFAYIPLPTSKKETSVAL